MEKGFVGKAVIEIVKSTFVCVLFCLLAEALFAVFIRAFSFSYPTITAVNWVIQMLGILLGTVLCIRKDRAFFKGIGAGIFSVIMTMLVFGLIGGGIYLNAFFALKIILGAVVGGLGAYLGSNLRKE